MQLRLRTCLQTEVELTTMGDNLFDDRLHLVDLDGVDHIVLAFIFVLLRGFLKTAPGLLDTVVEDIRETKQHGWRNITQRQLVHYLTQVDLRAILTGSDVDIAFIVDAKIGSSPPVDVVELLGVVNSPFLHKRYSLVLRLNI